MTTVNKNIWRLFLFSFESTDKFKTATLWGLSGMAPKYPLRRLTADLIRQSNFRIKIPPLIAPLKKFPCTLSIPIKTTPVNVYHNDL